MGEIGDSREPSRDAFDWSDDTSTTVACLQTFTGRNVYPLALRHEDVDIIDIAHHLALVNRFTGATRVPYSVAEHSVRVSYRCSPEDALWGLLHDAAEAYLLDLPKPLKQHFAFSFYRHAESRVMRTICEALGLWPGQPESVTIADKRMLATEWRDLMIGPPPDAVTDPYPETIIPTLMWAEAEIAFINRFIALTRKVI